MDDLLYARDKIIMGLEHKKEIDVEMNKMVAYHESGHALVAYYNKNANNLHKVTIVPRAGTLGHVSFIFFFFFGSIFVNFPKRYIKFY